jgi:hypothetical protein
MPSKYADENAVAINQIWLEGFALQESGEVEASCGAFALVEHDGLFWIAREDSQGFFDVESFGSREAADEAYEALCAEYQQWDLHPDDCLFCQAGESQIHNYEPPA